MKLKEIIRYTHDKVSIYKDNGPGELDRFLILYEGDKENIPQELLQKDIKNISAVETSLLDILII
jgi:hypothetical protein